MKAKVTILILGILVASAGTAAAQCPADCVYVDSGSYGPTCWCLGELGESCTATCEAVGGTCETGPLQGYAGVPGGSAANCQNVLDALTAPDGGVSDVNCGSSAASGCAVNPSNGFRFRCSDPSDTPTLCEQVPANNIRRACSCDVPRAAPLASTTGMMVLVAMLVATAGMLLRRGARAES